jgi:hypothetical protein
MLAALARGVAAAVLCCVLAVAGRDALAAERPSGLPAVIAVAGADLDAGAIEAAVEHELEVPLVIDAKAVERLEIRVTGRRANVTYYAPGRDPVTRSLELPKDRERALETIAFLGGNLARDEASELLAQLAPPAVEPVESPPPSPPAPPPPANPPQVKPPASVTQKPAPPASPNALPPLLTSKHFAGNVTLFYPATARPHTERWRLNAELGMSYSRVGAIKGVGLALGYLRVDQDVDGVAAALGWTRAGEVHGIQAGLIGADGAGRLKGIQVGLLLSLRQGNVEGLQASALVVTANDVLGIEGAPLVAVARDVQGFQGSAAVSVGRDVRGVRLGVVAVGRDALGVQGGVVNIARDTTGAALGIVNVGRRVRGLQLGLVNVAESIDGGAIGLVNIAGNGRFQPVAWFVGPTPILMGGYKSITGYTYTQAGIGYDLTHDYYRWEVGTGLHLNLGYGFYGETGLTFAQTNSAKANQDVRKEVRYDARVGFEPVRGVTPFVGGGVSRRLTGEGPDFRGEFALGVSFL